MASRGPRPVEIVLTAGEREQLGRWARQRRSAAGPAADGERRAHRGADRAHPGGAAAARRHALVDAPHGGRQRPLAVDGLARLADLRPAAAPRRAREALQGSAVRREGARHRRPLPRPAGAVSYTHLRAHETRHDLVCRLLLEKKKKQTTHVKKKKTK